MASVMRVARLGARVAAGSVRPRVALSSGAVAATSVRAMATSSASASAAQVRSMAFGHKASIAAGAAAVAGLVALYAAAPVAEAKQATTGSADWQKIRKEIEDLIDSAPADYDDGSYGPMFVRLAWHAAGTYDKNKKDGGSNGGRIRFEPESKWGGNAGLDYARKLLEPIKQRHPEISYADLFTFVGVVAIEYMGGPKIPWRPGRSDEPDGRNSPADGRLPDASKDQSHIRAIFYRMGFNDREIVALSGAHSLGRCHTTRSGFTGPWTRVPTSFTNEYYRELLENTWTVKKWNGPKQYEDPTGELMMLETDMALIRDPEFKKWVDKYAKDQGLFFRDFATAFAKLLELGVPFPPVPQ